MYEVYLHKNIITNKVYIGFTGKSIMERWQAHCKKAFSSKNYRGYFHRAIAKYGIRNWSHSMLEISTTLEEAEQAEIKWIKYYNSNNKKYGYNLTSGGQACKWNESSRNNLSRSIKLWMSHPERRLNLSKKMKQHWSAHPNPFLGRKHSTESKLKMSLALKGRFSGENNPYYGKKHAPEVKEKMSELAKIRCSKPNWKAPLQYGIRDETRKKMSEARKGKPTGKYTKDQLLAACIGCKTQKQIAEKLKCTPANISFLIRHFQIVEELKSLLKQNQSQ